ncbi:hypothetical protein [Prosthecobacter sp.]|uniref:hypothetical protein n=1 Tax=Prosthecobacter sp. TaxID=1965333 RepID=UPI003783E2ED
MSEEKRPVPAVVDALSYPLVRISWFLLVVLCAAGFLVLVAVSTLKTGKILISGRIIFAALALVAVVVRCYFTIIEQTLIGWGKEEWQNTTMDTDDMWSSLLSMAGLACIAWVPVFAVAEMMAPYPQWRELVCQITAALGCEYFCMGTIALIVFNNFSQVLPHRIVPAMIKSGASFMLCGATLVLVPLSFQIVWGMLPASQATFVRALIACSVSAYFLIAHARFMGLLYLASRERIGWEE